MAGRGAPPTSADDRAASLGAVFAYSLGLGIATVTIPLVALDAGYDAAAVGFLVATAAACQFATRLTLPWLLGRFPDRALIGLAGAGMVTAFSLLIISTALPTFVAAQLLQGASRALFWTSSQTHAVRSPGRPLRRLVDINIAGNAGTLIGPALGGMLAVAGLQVSLAAAAIAAVGAAIGSRYLRPLPAYDRRQGAGALHLLRRDGVDIACWASVVGGGWWSMMGSYMPVLGVAAGVGSVGVGWLLTLAEGSGMVALIRLRRLPPERIRGVVPVAAAAVVVALVGIAVASLAATPAIALVFAVLMAIGGAASGTITTLAPAMASLAAGPQEQGDAMALTGTFRAGALLTAPALVGAMLTLVGVPVAVIVVASASGLPGLFVGLGAPRPESRPDQ